MAYKVSIQDKDTAVLIGLLKRYHSIYPQGKTILYAPIDKCHLRIGFGIARLAKGPLVCP